jgi:hypothetical protein
MKQCSVLEDSRTSRSFSPQIKSLCMCISHLDATDSDSDLFIYPAILKGYNNPHHGIWDSSNNFK